MQSSRIENIDITKGIGIFLVILGHFAEFKSPLYHYIYLFHMPLFFFLSGMFYKSGYLKDIIIKKSKRLLIPYVFYWLFDRIVGLFIGIITTGKCDFLTIDYNLFSGGVLWFLISLWSVFIIWSSIEKLGTFMRWGLLFIMIVTGLYLGENEIRCPLYFSQTLLMLPFFVMGNIFYKKQFYGVNIYQYIIGKGVFSVTFGIALIVFLIPCDFLDVNGPVIPNVIQYFITPLAGIILILIISKSISRLWDIIRMGEVGQISLHILGVHAPFIQIMWLITIPVVIRFYSWIGLSCDGNDVKAFLAIELFLAICLTIISYHIGKYIQTKFTKLFNW